MTKNTSMKNANSIALAAAAFFLAAIQTQAQSIQYGTGTFTWDNGTTAAWSSSSGGPYNSVWTSGNDAVLEGTAGTVSVDPNGATADGLTFNATGYTIQNNTLTLGGVSFPSIAFGAAGYTATISSIIAGSAGLTVAAGGGAGTLTLSGPNTFTGGLTVNSGTVSIASDGNLGASAAAVTLNGGGLYDTTGFSGSARAVTIGVNGATLDAATNQTFNIGHFASITGSGRVIKGAGPGNVQCTYAAVAAWTGGLTINGGTYTAYTDGTGSSEYLGAYPASPVANALEFNGGTLAFTGPATTIPVNRGITLDAGGGTINGGEGLTTINSVITGPGLLNVGVFGLTLNASNTFTGGVLLPGGQLNLNNNTALGSVGTFTISGGATIDNTSANAVTNANNNPIAWTSTGTLTYGGTANLNLGTGTVTISGSRTLTGNGTNTLTIGGNITNTATSATETVTITGTNKMVLNGAICNSGAGGTTALTINGPTVTLAGNSSGAAGYSGATTLTAGTINVNNNGAFGNGSAVSIAGVTLDNTSAGPVTLSGNTYSLYPSGITLTYAGSTGNTLDLGTGAMSLNASQIFAINAGTLKIGGIISDPTGTKGLTKTGIGGTLVLYGANTFSGNVSVVGTLVVQNSSALGTGTTAKTVNVNAGTGGQTSILQLDGSGGNLALPGGINFVTSWASSPGAIYNSAGNNVINGNISMTTGNGNTLITASGGTLTLNGAISILSGSSSRSLALGGAASGTVAGVISNSSTAVVSLIKQDAGTWTLANTNTYSGTTAVNGGTLLVNGAIGTGAVTVAANATLGGAGVISGATTMAAGATLAAGVGGIGTLTFSNGLTLSATSTNVFVVTTSGGVSNLVAVAAGTLAPNGSIIEINTAGSPALGAGTNVLFTYQPGSISSSFAATPVFSTAQTGPAANALIVDDSLGQIELVVTNLASSYATNPTNLTYRVMGGNTLTMGWPADHLGWMVQSNSLNLVVPADWYDISNTAAGTNYSITFDPTRTNVFYRLRMP